MANPIPTGFPNIQSPLVDENGVITPPWRSFFQKLFTSDPSGVAIVFPTGTTPQGWVSAGTTLGGVAAPAGYQWIKRP